MNSGVLDLQQVVRNWAWRIYDDTATPKQKKLRKKQKKVERKQTGFSSYIGIQIDWSEVKFHDEIKWASVKDVDFDDVKGDASGGQDQSGPSGGEPAPDSSTPGASLLFKTTYTNNTDETQEYTIKTAKTTRSSCTTEIKSSYTKGNTMSVTLKTPAKVFEANAGYHRQYSLTNADGETFEEELTWGVDSPIKVPKKHVANATLVVTERKQQGNFVINSEIQGMVFVTFTDIRDDNSLLKATGGDIASIVATHLKNERKEGNEMKFVEIDKNNLKVRTEGRCNFRYGINQQVKVSETKIT